MTARDRRGTTLLLAAIALACALSVWPIVASRSVPAFQQDWAWPLSRPLAWEWLKTFVGLWDGRSTAHANLLPWQTYAVVAQTGLIAVFGASLGLAVWIAGLELLAAACCAWMLRTFGVTSWMALFSAAAFYAFGPVVFTRIAAGHLAYLVGYALLPLAIALACRAIERRDAKNALALGVTIGLAGSQIQFLAIAWLAIAPLPFALARAPGWGWRLAAAAGIGVAVQLQALLPLAFGSAAAAYAMQPALLAFEYNNSAPLTSAPVMLGYFTHYYETHALTGAFGALYALLAAALALAIFSERRSGVPAVALVVAGSVLAAGLYGPASGVLSWAFEHVTYAEVFRDLHYFAALTALGIALGMGAGLQRLPPALSAAALFVVGWIVLPTVAGAQLQTVIVPRTYVDDTLSDMRVVDGHGPGRVLWLPAEEPLGPIGARNQGRDFTAYGPAANPSVSDDYQNPQLAYALATLRSGTPDWNAFAELNVRYFVVRDYVRSGRRTNFGVRFPVAFAGLDDARVAELIARAPNLRVLQRSALSTVYAFDRNDGFTYVARADPRAMLYSHLGPRDVALEPATAALHLRTSRDSPDPRAGWVEGRLGWRYVPWLPDSIYPFVWTLSDKSLELTPLPSCVLAAALPHGALLRSAAATLPVRGVWKRYLVSPARSARLLPQTGDVTTVATRACAAPQRQRDVFVFSAGYDAGWRALDAGRLVAPTLANGWMMAWDARVATAPRVYLPAWLQLAGLVVMVGALITGAAIVRKGGAV